MHRLVASLAVTLVAVAALAIAGTSVAHNKATVSCSINIYRFTVYNGKAATDSSQTCSGVSKQTLTVKLLEFWTSDNSWHLMSTSPQSSGGSGTIYAGTTYPCSSSETREWSNHSEGGYLANGFWTHYLVHKEKYLACRG